MKSLGPESRVNYLGLRKFDIIKSRKFTDIKWFPKKRGQVRNYRLSPIFEDKDSSNTFILLGPKLRATISRLHYSRDV